MLHSKFPSHGDQIAHDEGPFVFDVPLDDRTLSIWLDNGFEEWHGFSDHSHPGEGHFKAWCQGLLSLLSMFSCISY
jgi:hypothetical protein